MKKTLLLSEIFPPTKGGSGRWFWEVYNRVESGKAVIAAGEAEGAKTIDEQGTLETYRLPLDSNSWGLKDRTGFTFYWRTYWKVRKIIKTQKIKAVHCARCIPEGFIGYLLHKTLKVPYLCYVHGEDIETATLSRELSWVVSKALDGARFLICNSQNTASLLQDKWNVNVEKVKVIHPGVDATRFIPASAKPEIKNQLGWKQNPVILTVGRLQKRKGHDKMIQALALIKAKYPEVLYAIVGDGDNREALEQLVEQLELESNILFMSELSDIEMIQCYQQCDVFILPNRTIGKDIEGFGMVLVEAQACAKPVVAGDSGGTVETMVPEETGLIIDCTQPEIIAHTLLKLLDNPDKSKQMGTKGRQHVEQNLDWKMLARQAEALFAQL